MRISTALLSLPVLLALAACEPTVPDSGAGVGFDDYRDYGNDTSDALQGSPVATGVISDESVEDRGLSAAIEQAVKQTPALEGGAATYDESDPNRARATSIAGVASTAAISDEQDFGAVSSRETIQSDAERLAEQRAQYQEIAPTALPTRSGGNSGASIVKFALETTNSVGQSIYSRSKVFAQSRFERSCSKYSSPDLAQEAFLSAGGPKRDSKGLDPDGDGFACFWDPAPYRAARGG
jgi:hypothetical protein